MTPLEQAEAILKAAEEVKWHPAPWLHMPSIGMTPCGEDFGASVVDANGDAVVSELSESFAHFITLARNTAPAIALALIEKHRALEEAKAEMDMLMKNLPGLLDRVDDINAPGRDMHKLSVKISAKRIAAFLARQGATA